MGSESHLCLSPMEPTTNQTPTPSFPGDGVCTNEFTNLSTDSPLDSENDDGVDFSQEQGSKPNEAIDTENGSRSLEKNQYSETEDVVSAKDLQTEHDSLDDDVEIVIRNQHEYYFYCPCCGEDITKTVKLVKISDLQPTKNHDAEHKAIESGTENGSTYKDKKKKITSWFPDFLQQLFPSVYGLIKDKEIPDEKGVDSKSPGTHNDLDIHGGKPSSDVSNEKDRPSFPKWNINVFVWLFLCIVIALSVLPISPPTLIQPHLQLPSMPSLHLQFPSMLSLHLPLASVIWLLPMFAVLLLFIMSLRSRFSPEYQNQKGDKKTDSESTYTTSEEPAKTQYQGDQAANPDQDFGQKTEKPSTQSVYKENQYDKAADHDQDQDKKKDNQKTHLTPIYPSPLKQPGLQPKIPGRTEPRKDGSKIEILKSIVYGGLTESISSLCTVTSAAATGASTLNILALGVANLSSGLLLTVHSLQELINEKPRKRTDTDYSEGGEGEEEDRYEEVLGRREYSRLHKLIVISSFIIFGLIPPLVYGFSFRKRIEKKQEYKVLAVYAMSLLCVVLLSIAKAYVSKKRDYLKTLFRYTTMATTASGLSQFVGHLVSQWLEKSGFYDDSPVTQ